MSISAFSRCCFLPTLAHSLSFPSSITTAMRRGSLGGFERSRMETIERRSTTSDSVHFSSQSLPHCHSRPSKLEPILTDSCTSRIAQRFSGSALVRFIAWFSPPLFVFANSQILDKQARPCSRFLESRTSSTNLARYDVRFFHSFRENFCANFRFCSQIFRIQYLETTTRWSSRRRFTCNSSTVTCFDLPLRDCSNHVQYRYSRVSRSSLFFPR